MSFDCSRPSQICCTRLWAFFCRPALRGPMQNGGLVFSTRCARQNHGPQGAAGKRARARLHGRRLSAPAARRRWPLDPTAKSVRPPPFASIQPPARTVRVADMGGSDNPPQCKPGAEVPSAESTLKGCSYGFGRWIQRPTAEFLAGFERETPTGDWRLALRNLPRPLPTSYERRLAPMNRPALGVD